MSEDSRASVADDAAEAAALSATRAVDGVLQVLALGLAVSLLVAGLHDVSQGYDIWYYHLPFASRLVGIMDASTYAFSADNRVRYEGYPLFAELLQGIAWRTTSRIESTSLVSLGALFALPLFLRRLFAVPIHLSLLALLAIPLVQIHATSSYVDLPGNVFAAMLLLEVYRVIATPAAVTPRFLAVCAFLAAAAVNTKFQLVPIVTIASVVLLVVSLREVRSWRSTGAEARSVLRKRALIFLVAIPVVFATPLKNVALHGNPVWPVDLHVFGHAFPHEEAAYSQSPPHLEHSSRAIRFVRSALEIDNAPIASQRRWSLDQWAPPSDPSCRMGGFFGAYVALNLAALAWIVWRRRTREAFAAAAVMGGATAVVAFVPQSHELRYYMHWMILLVSLNLVLWAREGRGVRTLAGIVACASLSVVVWSTSAGFLYPSGSTFAEFLAKREDRSVLESVAPGERVCISREPFTFLYAPTFHAGKDYAVQEATRGSDCRDARPVP